MINTLIWFFTLVIPLYYMYTTDLNVENILYTVIMLIWGQSPKLFDSGEAYIPEIIIMKNIRSKSVLHLLTVSKQFKAELILN